MVFYRFPNLARYDAIDHGVFTRSGGCSKGHYGTLNLGLNTGDSTVSVQKNRKKVQAAMDGADLACIHQIHGKDVVVFDGAVSPESLVTADASITDFKGRALMVQVADCQPVLLYDPVKQVVANVHSGWRGSIANILGETLQMMEDRFGCDPSHIESGIGPSLGPCCAEFLNYKNEIPQKFWKYKDRSDHFDFWRISCDQLMAAGILGKNICVSRLCTKCNTDKFFSYRAEGETGRFASVIALV